jgi:hypothetical protein
MRVSKYSTTLFCLLLSMVACFGQEKPSIVFDFDTLHIDTIYSYDHTHNGQTFCTFLPNSLDTNLTFTNKASSPCEFEAPQVCDTCRGWMREPKCYSTLVNPGKKGIMKLSFRTGLLDSVNEGKFVYPITISNCTCGTPALYIKGYRLNNFPLPQKYLKKYIITIDTVKPYNGTMQGGDYPGGHKEFLKYYQKVTGFDPWGSINVHDTNNVSLIISYIVERDGSITNIKIVKGVPHHPEVDERGINIIKAMPRFTPGKQYGYTIRVQESTGLWLRIHE